MIITPEDYWLAKWASILRGLTYLAFRPATQEERNRKDLQKDPGDECGT